MSTESTQEGLNQVQLRTYIMNGISISSAAHISSTFHQRLATGCQPIDSFLRGGLGVGSITEVYGESAVGKSQLCLQLALMVQAPAHLGGLEASTY
jgi:RecA/RadA recombinase